MKSFSSDRHTVRILHLEDDRYDCELLKAGLESSHVSCSIKRIVSQETFEAALKEPVDLIISDSNIPGFNTFAALEFAREIYPEIPFVFLSGNNFPKLKQEALRQGASDFLDKADLVPLISLIEKISCARQAID